MPFRKKTDSAYGLLLLLLFLVLAHSQRLASERKFSTVLQAHFGGTAGRVWPQDKGYGLKTNGVGAALSLGSHLSAFCPPSGWQTFLILLLPEEAPFPHLPKATGVDDSNGKQVKNRAAAFLISRSIGPQDFEEIIVLEPS